MTTIKVQSNNGVVYELQIKTEDIRPIMSEGIVGYKDGHYIVLSDNAIPIAPGTTKRMICYFETPWIGSIYAIRPQFQPTMLPVILLDDIIVDNSALIAKENEPVDFYNPAILEYAKQDAESTRKLFRKWVPYQAVIPNQDDTVQAIRDIQVNWQQLIDDL